MVVSEKKAESPLELPQVQILEGRAVIDGLTIRNPDAVELVSKMDELEVEQLVDSLLASVAKVAEGTTTAQAVMKEFREKAEQEFREMQEGTEELFDKIKKDLLEELNIALGDAFKDLAKDNDELSEQAEGIKGLLEDKIRPKLEEVLQNFAKGTEEAERQLRKIESEAERLGEIQRHSNLVKRHNKKIYREAEILKDIIEERIERSPLSLKD